MKKICFLADRHLLYDDRTYWKQAISAMKHGFEVYYVVLGDEEGEGVTKEGIYFKQIKRKQYWPNRYINYLFKKIFPVKTEYDIAFEYCKKIKADIYQNEDLRINRIIHRLKRLPHHPKLIYDIREPRDNNLKDIEFKTSALPVFFTHLYADYIQKWEYKKAKMYHYLLAVDDGIYRRLQRNVPGVPQKIIYNFTNLKSSRQNIPAENKKFDAAYVGGISRDRGGLVSVKAAKYVVEKMPDFKLLLLGKIYDEVLKREIVQFISDNQISDNVILQDYVPYKEIAHYYNNIKIGLNPLLRIKAHEEIIQIKLFEYMNYGIPIITSNFGYMQSYIEENETGVAIEPNDEKLLADTIINLLKDKERYQKYSKNGVRAVDEKFNWDIMEKELLAIYDTLLTAK